MPTARIARDRAYPENHADRRRAPPPRFGCGPQRKRPIADMDESEKKSARRLAAPAPGAQDVNGIRDQHRDRPRLDPLMIALTSRPL